MGSNGVHDEDDLDILQQLKTDAIPERFLSLDALLFEVGAIKQIRIRAKVRHPQAEAMADDEYDLPEWEMERLVLGEQLASSVKLTDTVDEVQLDLPAAVEPEPLPPSAYTEEQGAQFKCIMCSRATPAAQALSKQTLCKSQPCSMRRGP